MRPVFRRFLSVAAAVAAALAAVPPAYDAYLAWRAHRAAHRDPVVAELDFDDAGGARLQMNGKCYVIAPDAETIPHRENISHGPDELTIRAPASLSMNRILGLLYAESLLPQENRSLLVATDNAGARVGETRLRFTICEHCASQGREILAITEDPDTKSRWQIGYIRRGEKRLTEVSAEALPEKLRQLAAEGRADGVITQRDGLVLQVFLAHPDPAFGEIIRTVSHLQSPEIHSINLICFDEDESIDLFRFLAPASGIYELTPRQAYLESRRSPQPPRAHPDARHPTVR